MDRPGCFALTFALFAMILMPFILLDVMTTALSKLHLHPGVAFLAVLGILIGGAINIPVHRYPRQDPMTIDVTPMFGVEWAPARRRVVLEPTETILAVNVGGCIIPSVIALVEIIQLALHDGGQRAICVATFITLLNVAVCYNLARPIPGLGIAMPAFIPPIIAAFPSLILIRDHAAPVAFIAGTLGPLIGADLLHLRDIRKINTSIASIGGAGTFDGIVLSGILAAFLA